MVGNSDGTITLKTKIDTSGISKAVDNLKTKINSIAETKAALQQLSDAIKAQQDAIKSLTQKYSLLVAKGKGNSEQAQQLLSEIKLLKGELGQLQGSYNDLGGNGTQAFKKIGEGIKDFGKKMAVTIKRTLIFSVIFKVMQKVLDMFKDILMSDAEFRQDWEELEAAFYTAAYPIVNLIMPAVKYIVQLVKNWAISLGQVAAMLQGISYSELVDQAEASKTAADNYDKMSDASAEMADNTDKQIASFDDIQTLSTSKEEQAEASAGFEGLKEYDTTGEQNMLSTLSRAIGGALAAVGLILLFKGLTTWGAGFIVAGAALYAISEIWGEDYDPTNIFETISNIVATVAIGLVAVGLILLFNKVIPWGIGFIVAGAALFAISKILEGTFSTDPIINTLAKIMGIAGTMLAALGIILMVAGQIPWGVGFLVAGAAMLATMVAMSNDAIVDAIQGPLGILVAMVSGALLVLGVILACSGFLPIGIALIIAGVAGLVTVVALNKNVIVDWLKGVWGAITNFWNKYIAPIFTGKFWLDLAKKCGNGLIGGFESAINGIISLFENMINWVVGGLNKLSFDVPDWVPGIGGKKFGFNIPEVKFKRVSFPRLAKGAVIPANKEFLAVLGDQKQGVNIEAPLQTIVDAFNQALDARVGDGTTQREEHYYLNETQLMSVIYKLAKQGEKQANLAW